VNGIESFAAPRAPKKTAIPTAVISRPNALSGRRIHATMPPRMNDQAMIMKAVAVKAGFSSCTLERTSQSAPALRRTPRPRTAATVSRRM
jgi:hypothetical protein